VAFRGRGMPIVLLTVLALSLCWSLGIVTLVVGHLSIFSVMFLSIVVGLGTDYGVYLLLRNAEESALGRPAREALEVTAMRAGPGMLGGALAAAGAFYVLMATDFPRSEERRVGKECRCRWARDQAEDGIRDLYVTGVQTCALPIYRRRPRNRLRSLPPPAQRRGERPRPTRARGARGDGDAGRTGDAGRSARRGRRVLRAHGNRLP